MWLQSHAQKHEKIVSKLLIRGLSREEMLDYFVFENMALNEPDFCPLYAKNQKCHDMEHLNCYLCGCPLFRASDMGLESTPEGKIYSKCSIGKGAQTSKNGKTHQDCTRCVIPHRQKFVKAYYDEDWGEIMREVL